MSDKRKAIIILGSHRSGTSAVARVLNILGADLGPSLLPPSHDNTAGFWEHAEIIQLDEWILRVMGSSWDMPCCSDDSWWKNNNVSNACTAIEEILRYDFDNSDMWLIKDPRVCCLLPIWKKLLTRLDVMPLFVLVYRHPRSVMASLHQRDGISQEKGFYLWLSHTLAAEHGTRGQRRILIEYDDLLHNTKNNVRRLRGCLGSKANGIDEVTSEGLINNYLQTGLCHHDASAPYSIDSGLASKLDILSQRLYSLLSEEMEIPLIEEGWKPSELTLTRMDDISDETRKLAAGLNLRPEDDPAMNELTRVAKILMDLPKTVSLVIPTQARDGERGFFLKAIYEQLELHDGQALVLREPNRPGPDEAGMEKEARRLGLEIVDYRPPFDLSLLAQLRGNEVYLLMENFPFGYLSMLAQYSQTRVLRTSYGVALVLEFKS